MKLLLLLSILVSIDGRSFVIDGENNQFLKDGKPFRYISGGMHYFRVPQEYWVDRLHKIRKSGCNAVQTLVPWNIHEPYSTGNISYLAWNTHEPSPGNYQYLNELVTFIKMAQQQDLLVILRIGPYICGEWEFGGLPYWLLKDDSMKVRTLDKTFILYVERWLATLLPILKPLLYANGGPVIMAQVENEYGSYGCDHNYINTLAGIFRKYLGNDVILFTTDGAGDGYLKCGTTDQVFSTVDFGAGGDPAASFAIQRKYQPKGPSVNSEYYTGWLDNWGMKHQTRDTNTIVNYLEKILALNASVNMYMFEGGTDFGFMNGANAGASNQIQPQPTSYDYDAPLSEAGDPTEKYFAIQKMLEKFVKIPSGPQPVASEKKGYGTFHTSEATNVFSILDIKKPIVSKTPISFEKLDVPYGYVVYRTNIPAVSSQVDQLNLTLKKYHDRAHVFVDRQLEGIMQLKEPFNESYYLNTMFIKPGKVLEIMVENQGRVNYGGFMQDTRKGLLDDVILNGKVLTNWEMISFNGSEITPQALKRFPFNMATTVPLAAIFNFEIDKPYDTFLKLDKWTKGFVLLNGINMGRYWTPAGPQKTLYIPKLALRLSNELIVVETDEVPSAEDMLIEFVDKPVFV